MTDRTNSRDPKRENRDPLTNEPGSHPVGTGVGAASGAAAGAAVGLAVGGPAGAVLGGAVGAVTGGAAGHAAGESVNPTLEAEFWRKHHVTRPYYEAGKPYEEYEDAYRYGWESAARPEYRGKSFDEVESELERGWRREEGAAGRSWLDVKDAARDAFDRVRS